MVFIPIAEKTSVEYSKEQKPTQWLNDKINNFDQTSGHTKLLAFFQPL